MRKILVVEDDDVLRDAYKLILSTEPYDVDVAMNGKEALDKCRDCTYDLILLDLMMPVLNGVQFLDEFNKSVHNKSRIIVLSNLSSGDMLDQAKKLGAYKSVIKADLSPSQLVSMVRYEVEAK